MNWLLLLIVIIGFVILYRKVHVSMATQEERLQAILGVVTSIANGVNTLQQQIEDLKAGNPEINDEIAALEATVQAIRDDLNGVEIPPAEEPPVEPQPES